LSLDAWTTGTDGGGVTAGGGGGLGGGGGEGGGGGGGGEAGGAGGEGGGGGFDGCVGWLGRGPAGGVVDTGEGDDVAFPGDVVAEASWRDADAAELPAPALSRAVAAVCLRGFACRAPRGRRIVTMRAEGGDENHDGSYGRPP
jgi:hypothetical protein